MLVFIKVVDLILSARPRGSCTAPLGDPVFDADHLCPSPPCLWARRTGHGVPKGSKAISPIISIRSMHPTAQGQDHPRARVALLEAALHHVQVRASTGSNAGSSA